MTEKLLRIYENEGTYSKTIWYKLLKILAHLPKLQEILFDNDKLAKIFGFVLTAY